MNYAYKMNEYWIFSYFALCFSCTCWSRDFIVDKWHPIRPKGLTYKRQYFVGIVWQYLLTYPFVAFRLAPKQTALPPCERRFCIMLTLFFCKQVFIWCPACTESDGRWFRQRSGGWRIQRKIRRHRGRLRFSTACMWSLNSRVCHICAQ